MTTPCAPIQPTPRRPRGRQAPARRPAHAMLLADETHISTMPGTARAAQAYQEMMQRLQQLPFTCYGTLCCGGKRVSIPVAIAC